MSSRFVGAAVAIAIAAGSLLSSAPTSVVYAQATPPPQTPAASWPSATVRFVLPLGPGSGADIGARMFADRLTKIWGQPIVIENRPGGDSIMAITTFTAAKDDLTLLWGPSAAFTAHPYTQTRIPYDPRDIVPIARASVTLVTMSAPATAKETNIGEFVARIRAEPGRLNWAALTGLDDFIFQSFVKTNGLVISRVPYRDAVGAFNDLSEGRINLVDGAFAIARPHLEAGKIKVLAFMNSRRAPVLPDVPTVREQGFPALEFDGLVGLYGPRGMAEATREKIAADVKTVADDPEVIARLTATGQVVSPGGPVEFAASIERQRTLATAAGNALGLTPAK